ncbi:hypothetical protein A4L30_10690 [Salmonella enterica subsp. enterica serovar Bovismorbificans]|nr:hypothetical protein [Salmonella enterica subsp. enterica serovar Bovismorbificans]
MSIELKPLVIRQGEKLTIANEEGATIQIGNSKHTIFHMDNAPANTELKTLDWKEGKYSIVVSKDDELVYVQDLTIASIFKKQDRKEFLREMIAQIEEAIEYRLSGDEKALSMMTIKSNTFQYESLTVLNSLRDSYVKDLTRLIREERRKKGISPIKNIKVRLTR